MDKRQRQVDMIRSKYLRQIVELLEKHQLTLEEVAEFQKSYKSVKVQMLEHRERKLAENRHALSLIKAREALAKKREAKQNGK